MAMVIDRVLTRFRAAVDQAFGARIDRIVLFGSRARGDFRPDSDYDVAVFIRDIGDFGQESGILAEIESDILFDSGAVISALPLDKGAYIARTGFMAEVRRDGIDV